jgi:ZIP family zinc transporter
VILFVGLLPFFSTLAGGVAAFRLRHRLHAIMAVAAGVLVATALVDLLPEAIGLIGGENGAMLVGVAAVVGYLIYAGVETFIHQGSYEHEHGPEQDPDEPHEHPHAPARPGSRIGLIAPAGLIVHSFLDGLAIGLSFNAGAEVGLIVTLAVLVHDFADGLNVVTLALSVGGSRRAAIVLLTLDAAAPIVGIGVSQLFAPSPQGLALVLGLFAGAFIAIGAGHLLPEAEHHRGAKASPLIALTVLGAAIVLVVRMVIG